MLLWWAWILFFLLLRLVLQLRPFGYWCAPLPLGARTRVSIPYEIDDPGIAK